MECRFCKKKLTERIFLKDNLYGDKDKFEYFHCVSCGCFQSGDRKIDPQKTYPKNYYSVKQNNRIQENKDSIKVSLSKWLQYKRNSFYIGDFTIIGFILDQLKPNLGLRSLKKVTTDTSSSICDVGCGDGKLLNNLVSMGYKKLYGIDPLIKSNEEIIEDSHLTFSSDELSEIDQYFDVIMLNHCFEHIEDQHKMIDACFSKLKNSGSLILRVPLSNSFAQNRYKENWIQFDAPRHVAILPEKRLLEIFKSYGFISTKIIYDSTSFQFWGSECSKKNISLYDSLTGERTRESIKIEKRWKILGALFSKLLNLLRIGDQAVFIFKKDMQID